MRRLFRQFSFPGGIPSHAAPETPGLDPRGRRARLRARPRLRRGASTTRTCWSACVIGDGEAETGPLAGELALQQVPQPGARRRGAADPAPQRLQDRQPDRAGPHPRGRAARAAARLRLRAVLRSSGDETRARCTSAWPRRSTRCSTRSPRSSARRRAPDGVPTSGPRWPMIVLRTPKGWTGPARGRRPAGRGHLARPPGAAGRASASNPEHLAAAGELAALLPARGAVRRRRARCARSSPALPPRGDRRMSANPHANGGAAAARPATCPTSATTPSTCPSPARPIAEATRVLGALAARRRSAPTRDDFRLFGPGRDRVEPAAARCSR